MKIHSIIQQLDKQDRIRECSQTCGIFIKDMALFKHFYAESEAQKSNIIPKWLKHNLWTKVQKKVPGKQIAYFSKHS